MKRLSCTRQHGLSLVELLLGLAITALVLAPMVPMLETASAAGRISGDQLALEQEARFAIDRITARIRATPPAATVSALPADWLKPAIFSFDSTNGTLIEQQGKETWVLAESVKSFNLTAPASAGGQPLIQVSLTLERGNARTSADVIVRMGGLP